VVALASLALLACREDEQGRTLAYDGVYRGGAMPEIDEATREALVERAQLQDF
jgi:hypothetical protein